MEPFHIVVGFADHQISPQYPIQHIVRDIAQIGDHGGGPAFGGDGEAHGLGGIVGDGEGGDVKRPQVRDPARREGGEEVFHGGDAVAELSSGAGAGENGQAVLLGEGGKTGDMVGMLVGDTDA